MLNENGEKRELLVNGRGEGRKEKEREKAEIQREKWMKVKGMKIINEREEIIGKGKLSIEEQI